MSYQNPNELKEKIAAYWDTRAEEFVQSRQLEFVPEKRARWIKECSVLTKPFTGLDVLDVGTGTGFLAILLSEEGAHCQGIDLSPQMITQARATAKAHGQAISFYIGSADDTPFEPESFDLIVTRNLTWTLPDAHQAYQHWFNLLKPEGVLINFDAAYGPVSFEALTKELEDEGTLNAHCGMDEARLKLCDAIKAELAISHVERPAWDESTLKSIGFSTVSVDKTVSERLYPEHDLTWNPVPLFKIVARKG